LQGVIKIAKTILSKSGKRIYSAELIEIKKFGGMLDVVRKESITSIPAPNFNDENIKKISDAITS